MLRLMAITGIGLFAAFMILGRDLSPEEKAALDLREESPKLRLAAVTENVTSAFAPESKRQGDYIPTLAELRDQSVPATAQDMVQVASLTTQTAPAAAVQTNTTRVTDTEKLMELLHPSRAAKKAVAAGADLREVTANRVNVRSGPSTSNAVLDQVTHAEIVRVVSDAGNGWVRIIIEGDGVEGFISAKFLKTFE